MSSYIRNMQRAKGRKTGPIHFGDNVGIPPNLKAKDLLARLRREDKKNV